MDGKKWLKCYQQYMIVEILGTCSLIFNIELSNKLLAELHPLTNWK